jgi:hypothetical protein
MKYKGHSVFFEMLESDGLASRGRLDQGRDKVAALEASGALAPLPALQWLSFMKRAEYALTVLDYRTAALHFQAAAKVSIAHEIFFLVFFRVFILCPFVGFRFVLFCFVGRFMRPMAGGQWYRLWPCMAPSASCWSWSRRAAGAGF